MKKYWIPELKDYLLAEDVEIVDSQNNKGTLRVKKAKELSYQFYNSIYDYFIDMYGEEFDLLVSEIEKNSLSNEEDIKKYLLLTDAIHRFLIWGDSNSTELIEIAKENNEREFLEYFSNLFNTLFSNEKMKRFFLNSNINFKLLDLYHVEELLKIGFIVDDNLPKKILNFYKEEMNKLFSSKEKNININPLSKFFIENDTLNKLLIEEYSKDLGFSLDETINGLLAVLNDMSNYNEYEKIINSIKNEIVKPQFIYSVKRSKKEEILNQIKDIQEIIKTNTEESNKDKNLVFNTIRNLFRKKSVYFEEDFAKEIKNLFNNNSNISNDTYLKILSHLLTVSSLTGKISIEEKRDIVEKFDAVLDDSIKEKLDFVTYLKFISLDNQDYLYRINFQNILGISLEKEIEYVLDNYNNGYKIISNVFKKKENEEKIDTIKDYLISFRNLIKGNNISDNDFFNIVNFDLHEIPWAAFHLKRVVNMWKALKENKEFFDNLNVMYVLNLNLLNFVKTITNFENNHVFFEEKKKFLKNSVLHIIDYLKSNEYLLEDFKNLNAYIDSYAEIGIEEKNIVFKDFAVKYLLNKEENILKLLKLKDKDINLFIVASGVFVFSKKKTRLLDKIYNFLDEEDVSLITDDRDINTYKKNLFNFSFLFEKDIRNSFYNMSEHPFIEEKYLNLIKDNFYLNALLVKDYVYNYLMSQGKIEELINNKDDASKIEKILEKIEKNFKSSLKEVNLKENIINLISIMEDMKAIFLDNYIFFRKNKTVYTLPYHFERMDIINSSDKSKLYQARVIKEIMKIVVDHWLNGITYFNPNEFEDIKSFFLNKGVINKWTDKAGIKQEYLIERGVKALINYLDKDADLKKEAAENISSLKYLASNIAVPLKDHIQAIKDNKLLIARKLESNYLFGIPEREVSSSNEETLNKLKAANVITLSEIKSDFEKRGIEFKTKSKDKNFKGVGDE